MEQDWEKETEQQFNQDDGRFSGGCLWASVAIILTCCVWGVLTIRQWIKLHHKFIAEQGQPEILFYDWDYISAVILKSAGVGFVQTVFSYLVFVLVIGMLALACAPLIKDWGASAPSGPRELK